MATTIGPAVRGRIVDQEGYPVRIAEFWIAPPDGPSPRPLGAGDRKRLIASVITDDRGEFRTPRISAGEYWIALAPLGETRFEGQPKDVCAFARQLRIDSDAGDQEIVVRVFRGVYIRGLVFEPSGDVARDSVVVVSTSDGTELMYATSDGVGKFAAGPIFPGTFRLQAWHVGRFRPSEVLEAQAGDDGLALQLLPGATMEVIVVDEQSGRPEDAGVVAYPRDTGDEIPVFEIQDDHVRVDGLEPGIYDVRAETQDGRVGVLSGIRVDLDADARPLKIVVSKGAVLVLRREVEEITYCEAHRGAAILGATYLYKGRGRIVVPQGFTELRYFVGENERTLAVDAQLGQEIQVLLTK